MEQARLNAQEKTEKHGNGLPPPLAASEIHVNRQILKFGRFIGFSPDGKTVLTASTYQGVEAVAAWNLSNGKEKWSFQGKREDDIACFANSPDGKILARGSYLRSPKPGSRPGGTLEIWNAENGRSLFAEDSRQHFLKFVFGPKGGRFATLDYDEIQNWEYDGMMIKRLGFVRGKFTRSIHDLTPDMKRIAHERAASEIEIWDLDAQKSVCVLKGYKGARKAAFSPCGRWIVAHQIIGVVGIWDANSGEQLKKIDIAGIAGLAISPDNKWLATGVKDEVVIWKMPTGEKILSLKCKEGDVGALAFNQKGDMLAATSRGSWYVWALSSPEEKKAK
jgi:WD40 repeat protein